MNRRQLLAAAVAAPVAAKVTRAALAVGLDLGAAARNFEVGTRVVLPMEPGGWTPRPEWLEPVLRVTAIDHKRGIITVSCDE